MWNAPVTCFLALVLLAACSTSDYPVLHIKDYPDRRSDFSLWQLDQFHEESQMGYIIRTDDKRIIIIDGGTVKSTPFLRSYIRQLGGVVDTWIITHPHPHHAGALKIILGDESVRVNRIFHTAIDLDLVGKYEPASLPFISSFYEVLGVSGIQVNEMSPGEVLELAEGVQMKILGAKNAHIPLNHVNNSSLVFKIISNSKSVLFLGDLGIEGGNEILKKVSPEEIKSKYVQMAHHGQDGVSIAFYRAVGPEIALWPSPRWLWENNLEGKGENSGNWKTMEVRTWMTQLQVVQNIVSGIEGTVQID